MTFPQSWNSDGSTAAPGADDAAAESPGVPADIDLERLTQLVYRLLQRDLNVDRERGGR